MSIDITTVVRDNPDGILPGILDFLRIVELIIPDVEIEGVSRTQGEVGAQNIPPESVSICIAMRGAYAYIPLSYVKCERDVWTRQIVRLYAPTEAHPRILRILRDHYGNRLTNRPNL